MNNFYTVLCEVRAHKIQYKGRDYVQRDFVLLPKHIAKQYKDAVRILSREEQLRKEWAEQDASD